MSISENDGSSHFTEEKLTSKGQLFYTWICKWKQIRTLKFKVLSPSPKLWETPVLSDMHFLNTVEVLLSNFYNQNKK